MGIRNSLQELVDEILNYRGFLTNRGGADLLVIADDNNVATKVKCDQSHDVALTGFINNDCVKACLPRIEVLDHSREGHDPDRNGTPALGHFTGRLGTQTWSTYAGALTDFAYGIEPTDERLPLRKRRPSPLKHPSPLVNEVNGPGLNLAGQSIN